MWLVLNQKNMAKVKDFADVIKAPHQMTLNGSRDILGGPDLIK